MAFDLVELFFDERGHVADIVRSVTELSFERKKKVVPEHTLYDIV